MIYACKWFVKRFPNATLFVVGIVIAFFPLAFGVCAVSAWDFVEWNKANFPPAFVRMGESLFATPESPLLYVIEVLFAAPGAFLCLRAIDRALHPSPEPPVQD
jgi:hypothetical protein